MPSLETQGQIFGSGGSQTGESVHLCCFCWNFFLTQISSLPDYLPLGHWGYGGAKLLIASSNDASVWEFEWHLFTERLNWQFSLPVAQVILWVVYICLARHKMEKGWQSLSQNKQNNIDGKKIHLKDEKYWLWTPNNYIGRKIIDACIN